MAHEIIPDANGVEVIRIADTDDSILSVQKSTSDPVLILISDAIFGVYLTKSDTEALIQYLQSRLPELK